MDLEEDNPDLDRIEIENYEQNDVSLRTISGKSF